MGTLLELLDVHSVVLKLHNCPTIVVEITVVGCRKYSDYSWKFVLSKPFIHSISFCLCFMSTNNRHNLIFVAELLCYLVSKIIRASTSLIGLGESI